jgi:3',5'-cyclic AMP phosphodiesterase CpdA
VNLKHLRAHAKELDFTPCEPVRWLDPASLVRTGVKVALADVFAAYADKREIQGTLRAEPLRAPLDDPDAREMWIDYVADLGDGFDATASVAGSLAAPGLTVRRERLPRGSLLVLGGDETYPVASMKLYRDSMTGPYASALPSTEGAPPLMLALPGNHDWYDGLTAFLRTFALRQRVGGWQTRQTRSYFAVRLPSKWWLVGLDSQLGAYLDDPQLRYFQNHLSARLRPGDGVIVCCAEPTWVKCADDADAFDTLHWFDHAIIRTRTDPRTGEPVPTGASIRLWLTGDKHHYARYAERLPTDPPEREDLPPDPRRRQMVTCGLGGAYLASTHTLPRSLSLPPTGTQLREKDDPAVTFTRADESTYPEVPASRRLARRIAAPWSPYWLPRRNPGFCRLTAAVHTAAFVVFGFLFAVARDQLQPVDAVRHGSAADLGLFTAVTGGVLVVLWGLLRRTWRPRPAKPRAADAVLLQALVALGALAVNVALPFPAHWPGWAVLLVCLAVAAVLGAVAGSQAFALWVLSARGGAVADWQMSGQAVEDHKGFLRLHIAPNGDLTLHALVLDRICRRWNLADAPGGRKRAVPAEPLTVRLIEDPVVIAREAKRHDRTPRTEPARPRQHRLPDRDRRRPAHAHAPHDPP